MRATSKHVLSSSSRAMAADVDQPTCCLSCKERAIATLGTLAVKLDADTRGAMRGLQRFGNGLRTVSRGAGKAARFTGRSFAVIGAGLLRVGALAGAGAAAAGGWGLKMAAATEQAKVGFETMLGSGEKAKAFLDKLKTFAAKTPFEFPELRTAASRLVAVGVNTKDVIPLMRALGDATAGMGTGSEGIERAVRALTQMRQKGKVTGEEMLQLVEAGIPAWDALANKLGVDVTQAQDMVEKRLVDAPVLFEALSSRAGPAMERLTGLMKKQSATLGGMLSTLKDTVGFQLQDAMAPALQAIKKELPGLTKAIGNTLKQIGPQIAQLAEGIVKLLGNLLPVLAPIIGVFARVAAVLFNALAPALKMAAPLIRRLAELFGNAMVRVLKVLAPLLPPIITLLAKIAAVIIRGLATAIITALPFLQKLAIQLGTAILQVLQALMPVLPPLVKAFGRMLTTLAGPLGRAIAKIAPAFAKILIALIPLLPPLTKLAVVILREFLRVIIPLLPHLVRFTRWVVGIAVDILPLVTSVARLVVRIASLTNPMFLAIRAFSFLSGAIGNVIGFFASLGRKILNVMSGAGGWLVNVGKNIIRGLWNGIAGMGRWLWRRITNFVKNIIPGPIKRFLGIGSPSKLMMGFGRDIAAGLARGMESGGSMVARAANGLAASTVPGFGIGGPSPGFGGGQPTEVVLEIDGRELGRATVDVTHRAFADKQRRNATLRLT